jgi:hypothetical protein
MIGLTHHSIQVSWMGKPRQYLTMLFEPLRVSRVHEEGSPGKDFFKIFVDGHRGNACVFTMDNRHVRSF